MKTAKIVYKGDLRTECTHLLSGSRISTDAPPDNQGKGENFSPTDLTTASLGACMLTIMGIYARAREWNLVGTELEAEKIMGTNPRRIIEIIISISIPAFAVPEKERQGLETAAKNCPVAKSLHPEINQKVSFFYK